MGYLTGGPQRYTGRPMDVAHKHLGISRAEWAKFTAVTDRVLKECGVPRGAARELLGIIAGFEDSCTLRDGEAPWPEPVNKAHPSAMGTPFHRLGGVYPLSRFVSALVDAVLETTPKEGGSATGSSSSSSSSSSSGSSGAKKKKKLRLPPLSADDDPLGRRHAAGLKYVVTELVCHALEGPEVATVRGFDEVKLGVRADEWEAFLEIAQDVSGFFPTQHHRNLAMRALEAIKADLCIGMAANETGDVTRFSDSGAAAVPTAAQGSGKCPFSGSSASSAAAESGGKCPFRMGGGGWKALVGGGASSEANLPKKLSEADAHAATILAEKGIDVGMIAIMLKVDEASVDMAIHPEKYAAADDDGNSNGAGGGGGKQNRSGATGKMVGNELQMRLDKLEEEDPDLCCPVTLGLFVDPVTLPDGFAYERETARMLTRKEGGDGGTITSPMTRRVVPAELVEAPEKRAAALAFRVARARELTKFASAARLVEPHLACKALERVGEYLAALQQQQHTTKTTATNGGAEDDDDLCEAVQKVCDALIATARTVDNPDGLWREPKPAALRALHALRMLAIGAGDDSRRKVTCVVVRESHEIIVPIDLYSLSFNNKRVRR